MSCRHEDLVLLYFIDYYYIVKPVLFYSFVSLFNLLVPLFPLLFCLWNYGVNLMLHNVATLGLRPQRQMIMTSDDSDILFFLRQM